MYIFAVVLAVATGSLSGCGTERRTESGNEGTPIPEQKREPIELIIYSNNSTSENAFNTNYGDAIRKAFPQYTITYILKQQGTTMPEVVAAGTKMDIYFDSYGNYEGLLRQYDLQRDMTELVKERKIDLTRLESTAIEAALRAGGGKLYGLPVLSVSMALFYNMDIFDKFGVPYPKDGMTWDELLELSGKLTRFDDGKQYYGFSTVANHMLRMNQLSIPNTDMQTGAPTIHTDPRWKVLFDTVFVRPSQFSGYRESMQKLKQIPGLNEFAKDQSVAMMAYINSLPVSAATELKGMKWDILPLPDFPGQPGIGAQAHPVLFGLTSQTRHVKEAMDVLEYMVSETYQLSLAGQGLLPAMNTDAVRKRLGQDTAFADKNFQALMQKPFAPLAPKDAEYDAQLVKAYENQVLPLVRGSVDMNTAFRTAEEEAKKVIADNQ